LWTLSTLFCEYGDMQEAVQGKAHQLFAQSLFAIALGYVVLAVEQVQRSSESNGTITMEDSGGEEGKQDPRA
jgi:hypothetical protein